MKIFILGLLAVGIFSGCLEGHEDATISSSSASITSLTLKSYDTQKANLNAKGNLRIPGIAPLTYIALHASDACTDSPLGQGTLSDFPTKGIDFQTPSVGTTKIYIQANAFKDCFYLTTYTPTTGAPPVPLLTSTSPASPSRVTYQPFLFGTATAAVTQIRFYDDTTCTHLVGLGTRTDFSTVGIQVTLQPNTKNAIYVLAFEAFGNATTCTQFSSYTHSTVGPNAPTFTSVTPLSPTKITTTPLIFGTAPTLPSSPTAGVVINLFSDASCTTQIGTGAANTYATTGIEAKINSNSLTNIYAMAYDASGNPSACGYQTTFIHDIVAPVTPVFLSANPISPTRLTIYPRIKGSLSADSAQVKFYSDIVCLKQIGIGTKVEFESVGTIAKVAQNDTTFIYATAVDLSGNESSCTLMTSYYNNVIPPNAPVFNTTNPISPNNKSITPYVIGNASVESVSIQIFDDQYCTHSIGSGLATNFASPGIQVTVTANATTTLYANATDAEGNISTCTVLSNYLHSTLAAPAPAFSLAVPPSPNKTTLKPWIVGTASLTVKGVQLFSDNTCQTQLASGTRAAFVTTGIGVTVNANANTDIYALSFDMYGNYSLCTFLTSYINDSIAPFDPVFTATAPVSPNNQSTSPIITGTTLIDALNVLPVTKITFYDSFLCLSQLGFGTPAEFSGSGIQFNVPSNSITSVYGQTSDAAGNTSNCTFLTNYTHVDIKPGSPAFLATLPASPSYTQQTLVTGALGTSKSLLPISIVNIYSDPACTSSLTSSTPGLFTSTGIPTTMLTNTTTTVYAASLDQVGNKSPCIHLTDFLHNNFGPTGINANILPDGSVGLAWQPDMIAQPSPKYILMRSLRSGGPYTVLDPAVTGTSYTDLAVTNHQTYYYVVAATNNTGTSFSSSQTSITVSTTTPNVPDTSTIPLGATGGPGAVTLTWSGDATDMTFKVLRATNTGGPYTQLVSKLTLPVYIDSNVTNGTSYFYIVVGTNPAGDSIQSNEVNATPLDAPPAPLNLSLALDPVICGGSRGVVLTWSAPPYYLQFKIYRGSSSGGESFYSSTPATKFVDCSIPGQNQHYYYVTGTWGAQESPISNEVAFENVMPPNVIAYPGDTKVMLSWNIDFLATSYTLLRSTKAGGPYTTLAAGLTSTNYADTGLTNGTPYFYVLQAVYPNGLNGWPFVEYNAIPNANPTNPANLNLVPNAAGQAVLTWSPSSAYNYFLIYRSASPGGPFVQIGQNPVSMGSANTFTDATPLPGMNYYEVTTVWGTYETPPTNVVSYQYGIPKNLLLTPGASSLSLSWTGVTGATGYNIYRGTLSGGPYSFIGATASTTYSDLTPVAATGYFYVVAATFASGPQAPNSVEVSGMLTGTKVPSGITIASTQSNSIGLTWASVNGATYNIYKSLTLAGTYTKVNTTAIPLTTYNVTGLLSNTKYYFAVTSIVAGSESAKSVIVNSTTSSSPGAPTLTPGNNSVSIQWSGIGGATYDAQRSVNGLTFVTVCTNTPSSTCTDSTVSNGTLYYYRIITYTATNTMTSSTATITPGITPNIPDGLSISQNTSGTDITVAFAGVPTATLYTILVGTSSGTYTFSSLQTGTPSNNVINGLTSGTTYYLAVKAWIGNMPSGISSEIAFIPRATPSAPIALANSPTSVKIDWSSAGGMVTDYDLLRSSDGVNYTAVATGLGTTTTWTDATAIATVPYTYYFQPYGPAHIAMAPSAVSLPVTLGVQPLAPPSLMAEAIASNSVKLSWVQVPNIIQFNIYRGTSAGGPYTLLSQTPAGTFNYIDTTATGGSTYFYVVRSVNISNVESSDSNEVGMKLVSGPLGLTAAVNGNAIKIDWSSSIGASSYQLRRSEVMGGPYGIIASGIAGISYLDTNVANGIKYYYVVDATYASGENSLDSAEASATASIKMNLQVPIELIDRALSSDQVPLTFERSRTSLDTNDYDGSPTYTLETIVINADASPYSVELVDSTNATVASLIVPANTFTPTRIPVLFTPTNGAEEYRLKLPATLTMDSVVLMSARILVTQVNATKTKIYIPLLSGSNPPSHDDLAAPVESTNQSNYAELNNASVYKRDSTAYSTLGDTNPWEFEILISATGGATGKVALYDLDKNDFVDDTETPFSSSSVSLVRSPFNDGVVNFGTVNNGDKFTPAIACSNSCTGAGKVAIYKAGLWIKLTSLNKVDVVYRTSPGLNLSITYDMDQERTRLPLASFSNPTVDFQATGFTSSGGTTQVQLMSAGSDDFGPSVLTPIAGSQLDFLYTAKTVIRTSAPIAIAPGDRLIPEVTPTVGSFTLIDSQIIVHARP